ncbi:hypothetical protein ABTL52_20010, partial [Acinetobacter baumannii]
RLTALKSTFGVVEIWREGRQSGTLVSGEAKSFGRNSICMIWPGAARSARGFMSLFPRSD